MDAWWQPTFQTTVDAYYQGDLLGGRNACERLLSLAHLPDPIDLLTRRNAVFYAPLPPETAPSAAHRAPAERRPGGES